MDEEKIDTSKSPVKMLTELQNLTTPSSESTDSTMDNSKIKTKTNRELQMLLNTAEESKIIKEFNINILGKLRNSKKDLSFSEDSLKMNEEDGLISEINGGKELHSEKGIYNNKTGSDINDTLEKADSQIPFPEKIEFIDENGVRKDPYCWHCHKSDTVIYCPSCPRTYHKKCLLIKPPENVPWLCYVCNSIVTVEEIGKRTKATKNISIGVLESLLKFALEQMRYVKGVEPFIEPPNDKELPFYFDYVVQPMCLNKLEENLNKHVYGSTNAFLNDCKWIAHNSIIYNTAQSKVTAVANKIVKTCKEEMNEIEKCVDCYYNANKSYNELSSNAWFTEVCNTPHILLWAKLKRFPYWPAKGIFINKDYVDVRFFGDHNKAWVPIKDCYLYSEKMPATISKKSLGFQNALKELKQHIEKIVEKFGCFIPADFKTLYSLENHEEQLKNMIPNLHLYSFENELYIPKPITVKSEKPDSPQTQSEESQSKIDTENIIPLTEIKLEKEVEVRLSDISINNNLIENFTPLKSSKPIEALNKVTPVKRKSPLKCSTSKKQKMNDSDDDEDPYNIRKEYMKALSERKDFTIVRSIKQTSPTLESHSPSKTTPLRSYHNKNRLKNNETDNNKNDAVNETNILSEDNQKKDNVNVEVCNKDLAEDLQLQINYNKSDVNIDENMIDFLDNGLVENNVIINKNKDALQKIKKSIVILQDVKLNNPNERMSVKIDNNKHLFINKKAISKKNEELNSTFTNDNKMSLNNSSQCKSIESVDNDKDNPDISEIQSEKVKGQVEIIDENEELDMTTYDNLQSDKNALLQLLELQPTSKYTKENTNKPAKEAECLNNVQNHVNCDDNESENVDDIVINEVILNNITELDSTQIEDAPIEETILTNDNQLIEASINDIEFKLESNDAESECFVTIAEKQSNKQIVPVEVHQLNTDLNKITDGIDDQIVNSTVNDLIEENAQKLLNSFRNTFTDMMKSVMLHDYNMRKESYEIDRLKKQHSCEMQQLKHNMDLIRKETLSALKYHHAKQLESALKKADLEKIKAVEDTKFKSWCRTCKKETESYCCWNTSYCNITCQREHWTEHKYLCPRVTARGIQRTTARMPLLNKVCRKPTIMKSIKKNKNQGEKIMSKLNVLNKKNVPKTNVDSTAPIAQSALKMESIQRVSLQKNGREEDANDTTILPTNGNSVQSKLISYKHTPIAADLMRKFNENE